MKVNTVEQYKILQFIKNNFDLDCVNVQVIDSNTLKLTDLNGEEMEFNYVNGEVKCL